MILIIKIAKKKKAKMITIANKRMKIIRMRMISKAIKNKIKEITNFREIIDIMITIKERIKIKIILIITIEEINHKMIIMVILNLTYFKFIKNTIF